MKYLKTNYPFKITHKDKEHFDYRKKECTRIVQDLRK